MTSVLPLPPAAASRRRGVFVGRESEVARVRAAYGRACLGSRQAVLVGGEPGVGKTSLTVATVADFHEQGATVLWGSAEESVDAGYQPIAEALAHLASHCPFEILQAHAKAHGGRLGVLVPEVAERTGVAAPTLVADEERFALYEAAVDLVARASRLAPVVLVLDDLHWASKETLVLVRHLLRSPEPMALLVVGTFRDTAMGRNGALADVLADLRREPGVDRVTLEGLDLEAVTAFIEALGRSRVSPEGKQMVARLWHQTGGNPFFIAQLLGHLVDAGALHRGADGQWLLEEVLPASIPNEVLDAVGTRLDRLSPPARRCMQAAAVLGPRFSYPELVDTVAAAGPDGGDPADLVLDAMDEALAARLIGELDGGRLHYRFVHDLVRRALYEETAPAQRQALHRAAGIALEALPSGGAARAAILANHFSGAGPAEAGRAARYCLDAGRLAFDRFGFEAAMAHFSAGLAALDAAGLDEDALRSDLHLGRGASLRVVVRGPECVAAFRQAAHHARLAQSAPRLALAAVGQAEYGVAGIPDPETPQVLEEALTLIGHDSPALRAELLAMLAWWRSIFMNEGAKASSIADEALACARLSNDHSALSRALFARSIAYFGTDSLAEPIALGEELVELGRTTGAVRATTYGLRALGVTYLLAGDRPAFDKTMRALSDHADVHNLGSEHAQVSQWRTLEALMDGRFEDAEECAGRSVALMGDDVNARNVFAAQIFLLRWEQGRLEEVRPMLPWAIESNPRFVVFRAVKAIVDVELGDLQAAADELEVLTADDLAVVPRDAMWTSVLIGLTVAACALRDQTRAELLRRHLEPHSGQMLVVAWGLATVGSVDRYLGMLSAALGENERAFDLYARAAVLEESMGARPSLARTELARAELMAATGQDARAAATGALALATELGMRGVAERAETILRAVPVSTGR